MGFSFFLKQFIGRKSVFEIGICCANQHGIKAKIVINSSILLDFKFPNTPFYLNDFDIKANPLLTNVTFFKKKEHYALR